MRDEMGRDQQINATDNASSKRFFGLSPFVIKSRRVAAWGEVRAGVRRGTGRLLCGQASSDLGPPQVTLGRGLGEMGSFPPFCLQRHPYIPRDVPRVPLRASRCQPADPASSSGEGCN